MLGLSSLAAALGLLMTGAPAAGGPAAEVEAQLRTLERPAAVYVAGAPAPFGAAVGAADADTRRPLTVDTPVRMASVTKTFTAATVLRLHEQGRIDLDAPIASLLSPKLDELLRADGYDTKRITVRHLLSHTAGLYDHGADPRFIEAVLADPDRRWTREDQVRLSTSYADPQGPPGSAFRYSDTGYILLGDIIERITGKNLAAAVRQELRLDALGLRATWWERFEQPPAGAEPRARQYLGKVDATNVDPSMDLYGGGGLLMSARDLAVFVDALFSGRVFDRPATLQEMLRPGPAGAEADYRLGVFVSRVDGRELYWHSGFWGTLYCYDPATGRTVTGLVTDKDRFRALRTLVERLAMGQAAAAAGR